LAWAFGTSTTKDQTLSGATTIVQNKPASTVDGDFLVAFVNADGFGTITAPAGWTIFPTGGNQNSGSMQVSMYYKVAASEGASWTWSIGSGAKLYLGYVARYIDMSATPADVTAGASATASTINAPTVTTTVINDLVTRTCGTFNATSISFASGTSRINTGANGFLVVLADQNQAGAGATGTNLATANASNEMCAFTGAFKESVAGGATLRRYTLTTLGVG